MVAAPARSVLLATAARTRQRAVDALSSGTDEVPDWSLMILLEAGDTALAAEQYTKATARFSELLRIAEAMRAVGGDTAAAKNSPRDAAHCMLSPREEIAHKHVPFAGFSTSCAAFGTHEFVGAPVFCMGCQR